MAGKFAMRSLTLVNFRPAIFFLAPGIIARFKTSFHQPAAFRAARFVPFAEPVPQLYKPGKHAAILAFLLIFWFAVPANAGPKKVLLKIAEIAVDHVLPAVSSGLATNAVHNCRKRFGVGGGCPDGGYGEFKAREGMRFGFSVGMGELSHGCFASVETKKWSCLLIAAAPIALNTVTTIQARIHYAKKDFR
jgi:hypothetical protein